MRPLALAWLLALGCAASPPGTSDGAAASRDGAAPIADAGSLHDGSASTSGGIFCGTQGATACFCNVTGTGNAVSCGTAQVQSPGSCCADDNWPASGSHCHCNTLVCDTSGGVCTCVQDGTLPGSDSSCGMLPICCNGVSATGYGGCYCKVGGICAGGYTQVASCTAASIACDKGERRVSACR